MKMEIKAPNFLDTIINKENAIISFAMGGIFIIWLLKYHSDQAVFLLFNPMLGAMEPYFGVLLVWACSFTICTFLGWLRHLWVMRRIRRELRNS